MYEQRSYNWVIIYYFFLEGKKSQYQVNSMDRYVM